MAKLPARRTPAGPGSAKKATKKPPYISGRRIPKGFRTIEWKLSYLTGLKVSNVQQLHDAHYFHTITRLYQRLLRGNKRLAPILSKDLFNSDLVKRMGQTLAQLGFQPLTAGEITKILVGNYDPATSLHADPAQIIRRLEEAGKNSPVVQKASIDMFEALNFYRRAFNSGEGRLSVKMFIRAVERAYEAGGSHLESILDGKKGPWRFDKMFIADLMADGLTPKFS